jgi:VWFA-related protein
MADLRLAEDGAEQKIGSWVEHGRDRTPMHAAPLPLNTFASALANPSGESRTVVLVDVADGAPALQAELRRQALEALSHQRSSRADLALFLLDRQLHVLRGFDEDQDQPTAQELDRRLVPETYLFTEPHQLSRRITEAERHAALGHALRLLARYLAAFPGRKNIVWITSDPSSVVSQSSKLLQESDDAAIAGTLDDDTRVLSLGHIALSIVDARSLDGVAHARRHAPKRTDPLGAAIDGIARSTGGQAYFSATGVRQALDDVAVNGSAFYTLEYEPSNPAWDGRQRTVTLEFDKGKRLLLFETQYTASDPFSAHPRRLLIDVLDHGDTQPSPLLARWMMPGTVPPYPLSFQAAILADASEAPAIAAKDAPRDTHPYRIRYDVPSAGLTLTGRPGPGPAVHLRFSAVLFRDDGTVLASANDTPHLPVSASSGSAQHIIFNQSLNVPAKGEFFLRLAVQDETTERFGAIQIPPGTIQPRLRP